MQQANYSTDQGCNNSSQNTLLSGGDSEKYDSERHALVVASSNLAMAAVRLDTRDSADVKSAEVED